MKVESNSRNGQVQQRAGESRQNAITAPVQVVSIIVVLTA
jgi:hypothetical protein